MNIRKRILLYFSLVTIPLIGGALLFIYTLSSQNREREFQERQKEKITTTLKFLTGIRQLEDELIDQMDRLNIHDLIDEKLLIFNKERKLIYSSIDNTPIPFSRDILYDLSPENPLIETRDSLYDVVGMYMENSGKAYYGISKAYDNFGYSKLNFLKYTLIITFIGVSVIIILVSFYLSKKITQPIVAITQKIHQYDFETTYHALPVRNSSDEITILAQQFNKLMKRMTEVFAFQKHAINHISHELKTPVAILVSNFERMEKETDTAKLKMLISQQKEDTKDLGEIINSLLEIAKAEAGAELVRESVRADELVFDVVEELNRLYPDFGFTVAYSQTEEEHQLVVSANLRLLKAAFVNLAMNCIRYSSIPEARIVISNREDHLQIDFENKGNLISEEERQFLFQHFFRGKNSKGKRGFGLGLVFVHKIVGLHGGRVTYSSVPPDTNVFSISLPLRSF